MRRLPPQTREQKIAPTKIESQNFIRDEFRRKFLRELHDACGGPRSRLSLIFICTFNYALKRPENGGFIMDYNSI